MRSSHLEVCLWRWLPLADRPALAEALDAREGDVQCAWQSGVGSAAGGAFLGDDHPCASRRVFAARDRDDRHFVVDMVGRELGVGAVGCGVLLCGESCWADGKMREPLHSRGEGAGGPVAVGEGVGAQRGAWCGCHGVDAWLVLLCVRGGGRRAVALGRRVTGICGGCGRLRAPRRLGRTARCWWASRRSRRGRAGAGSGWRVS